MTIAQIQSFLTSKNSVCLQSFQTQSLNDANSDGLGDEPYGKGVDEKVSAATVIWQAAQLYKINPKVILVTLQKEQGLITREDCPSWRYNTALGYGCPDTAPCDNSAYGFTRQIDYGVWHFRGFYNDGYPTPPTTPGNRYIAYNPNGACGGTTLSIQNRATAALYSYTPYQPNAATLAAPVGQVVNCGAYGNLNFWRYYTDWFGSTTNPHLDFFLIKSADSPAVFLQTSAGKYYVPSGQMMAEWGLGSTEVKVVSQSLIDSLPSGPTMGRLLKDDWNNYFIVEDGRLHYVRDTSYLTLWGLTTGEAVQSLGITYTLPSGSWAGRFAQDITQPTGSYWLIDSGKKHLITDASMLYQWRYTPDQLTTVSAAYLSAIPNATGDVSAFATNGSSNFVVDSGRKLYLPSDTIKKAFYGSSAPVTYADTTLSFLPSETASQFTLNTSTGQWFMLEGGKRHYIANGNLADLWGKKAGSGLTSLSNGFMVNRTDGGNLSYVVQTASPAAYWLIDGNKRYIADSATADAWLGEGVSPPLYSDESVAALPQNPINATSLVKVPSSPYTYIMLNGKRHYLSTPQAKAAWTGTTIPVSMQLLGSVNEGAFLNYLIQTPGGQAYLLMEGKKYPIDASFRDVWGVSATTPTVSTNSLTNYETSSTLRALISIGANTYVMTPGGSRVILGTYKDAFTPLPSGTVTLPADYFGSAPQVSYLIKSSNTSDQTMWLVGNGQKTVLSFAQQVSFGYLSRGTQPTTLSPATLELLPNSSSSASNMIQKTGSGIKLLNFGYALGFLDGPTLVNFIPQEGVMGVAPSVFDSIPLNGNVSRVIVDDLGKYYLMVDGKRRWLSTYTAYKPYENLPRVYLYGTTVSTIPEGPAY
jgi:hypothetical protein